MLFLKRLIVVILFAPAVIVDFIHLMLTVFRWLFTGQDIPEKPYFTNALIDWI